MDNDTHIFSKSPALGTITMGFGTSTYADWQFESFGGRLGVEIRSCSWNDSSVGDVPGQRLGVFF